MDFTELLERVMASDAAVRHCIVADNEGNIIAVKTREGITRYLSEDETAASLQRAASAWKARKPLVSKLGKAQYALAAFENLVRITLPLGENHLLFVSMGSGKMRYDIHEGGQQQVVQHVLNILDGDPTTA